MKKKSLTGTHTQETIQNSIFKYINDFVICTKCGIPEINYTIKDKNNVESKCSACGSYNIIKNNNKINFKINDLILKYLQKNKNWKITKGNMILLKDYGPEIFGQEVDKLNEEITSDEEKITNNDEEKTTSNVEDDFNPFT